MRLLLINPNTSAHITHRLATSARTVLGQGDDLTAVTASNGPEVVRNAELLALANTSALAMAQVHAAGHDAIVLGISLDGAVQRLREAHPKLPIVGMTEAALLTACLCAQRIGVLTLGKDLLPLYRQRVEEIGLSSRVVAYRAPEVTSAFSADAAPIDPAVVDLLAENCLQMQREGAQAIVLAGAVLCGYAAALTARCNLATFDGVACAVGHVRIVLTCQQSAN